MYQHIMIPVDLVHADKLDKALTTAADLAKHYAARLHLVGVSTEPPSEVAHNPEEFAEKLQRFAADQSKRHGVEFIAKAVTSHDPAVDLDATLRNQCHALNIDLVVMASHVPGFVDYLFASNAGHLASHADISVFVVR